VVEQAAGAEAYYTEQPDWFDAEFFLRPLVKNMLILT